MSIADDIMAELSQKIYINLKGPDKRCCVEAFKKLSQLKGCEIEFVAVNRFIQFSKIRYEITFRIRKSKVVLVVPKELFSTDAEPTDTEGLETLDVEPRITARLARLVWDFYKTAVDTSLIRKDAKNLIFNTYGVSIRNGKYIYERYK